MLQSTASKRGHLFSTECFFILTANAVIRPDDAGRIGNMVRPKRTNKNLPTTQIYGKTENGGRTLPRLFLVSAIRN